MIRFSYKDTGPPGKEVWPTRKKCTNSSCRKVFRVAPDATVKCPHCGKEYPRIPVSATCEDLITCEVVITSVGSSTLSVIRVLRSLFGLRLPEAKQLVDHVPCQVAKDLDYQKANAMADLLRGGGAEVTVRCQHTAAPALYAVVLKAVVVNRLKAVQVIRRETSLSLRDSIALTDTLPSLIAVRQIRSAADHLRAAFQSEGIQAVVVPDHPKNKRGVFVLPAMAGNPES